MRAKPQPLPDPGPFKIFIDSFRLSLQSELKGSKTLRTYCDAVTRLGGWLHEHTARRDWQDVEPADLKRYIVWLDQTCGYSGSYVSNQFRALQQYWKWFADEEQLPNPFAGLKAPKPGEKVVPVLAIEDMAALIRDAEKGRTAKPSRPGRFPTIRFEALRDAALLRAYGSSGARLSELALLQLDEVDLPNRQALVTGKGNRQRWVRFDAKATQALDRYLRVRAQHPSADLPALWLGTRRRVGMTANGVYQMIARRGQRLGITVHPHMLRHTFSHRWLDNGGAEGDLMELNGWTSPQMLRVYGRSARSARARRAYDRIDVMGGI